MGYQAFFLKVVEDIWVRHLQDPDSFYTCISPRDLLDLLLTHIGGLERTDIIAMFSTMHLLWAEDPCAPKFINKFDNAQKKATRVSLPITNDCLASMATSALLSANSFPNDRPAWVDLVPSAQNWTAWKFNFFPLHSAMERELCASSQGGYSFCSANLSMAAHRITAALPTHTTTVLGPDSPDYMAKFNGHFGNLAVAATNSSATLDQLATNTTTHYAEIKSLLTMLKTASS